MGDLNRTMGGHIHTLWYNELIYSYFYIYNVFQGNEMKIQTIFESFEQFKLGKDNLGQLYTQVVAGLGQVG